MEVVITDRDIKTIEWIEDTLHNMEFVVLEGSLWSDDMRENLRNAQSFLHRIKTNAKTAESLRYK